MSERRPSQHRSGGTHRVARLGVLVAVAFVLSYLEAILPLSVGIPGVKLGLCHLVTVFALFRMSRWETVLITLVRVALSALLFGNAMSALYSLTGATVSLGVMMLLHRTRLFSTVGISVSGGVAHNLGQIVCAAVLMETTRLAWYLPVLIVSGCVTGAVIGAVSAVAVKRVRWM